MKNITPKHMRCGPFDCPSIHELEDGTLAIIGRKGPRDPMSGTSYFGNPIAESEEVVIIDRALLATIRDETIAALKGEVGKLADALENLLTNHCRLVESGDCGNWDVDAEPEVAAARALLDALPDRAALSQHQGEGETA